MKTRALLEATLDGFWVVDRNGRFVEVNEVYCAMSGYSRDDLLGRSIADIEVADGQAGFLTRMVPILDGRETRFEQRHRGKDGRILDLELSARPEGGSEGLIYVFLHDITRQRLSERLLKLHARILAALNAGGGDRKVISEILRWIQFKLDLESLAVRLREGEDYPFFVTLGLDKSFVLQERGLCIRGPGGRMMRRENGGPVHECLCGAVLEGGGAGVPGLLSPTGTFWTNRLPEEVARRTSEGLPTGFRGHCARVGFQSLALLAVHSGGETIGLLQIHDRRPDRFHPEMISALERITESIGTAVVRSRAEGALRETSKRLGLAVRSGKLAVWDWDVPSGGMIWDERMLEIYGLGGADFTKTVGAWQRALHPEDAARANAECQAALLGTAPFDTEFRILRPDGAVRVIKADAMVERDEVGAPLRMIGVNRDVTESHRQAAEIQAGLRRQQESLLRAQSFQRRLNTYRLPSFPGIELRGLYVPCQELGGDLLLAYRNASGDEGRFESPTDKLVILLGDCTGHGLETSIYAAHLVTLIESFLPLFSNGNDTARFLSGVNRRIAQLGFEDQFPTLFVGVLDVPNRVLHYSNANGVLPFHRQAGRASWTELPAVEGLHLGFDEATVFGRGERKLEEGDTLIFCSDAWFEREEDCRLPVEVRLAGLREDLAGHFSDPGATVDRIGHLARARFPGRNPGDDLTLLSLAVHPAEDLSWEIRRSCEVAESEKRLRACLTGLGWAPEEIEGVLIGFAELADNALHHGHGGDSNLAVKIHAHLDCERAVLRLRDEGPGFEYTDVADPRDGDRVKALLESGDLQNLCHGRGLFMARRYGELSYNSAGNEATFVCTRPQPTLLFSEQVFP
ncbi:MAG: PAS domain-containing protein [Spirochaetes bacterium]|nr:PAS domain-containing protein [Spirochaetota bacterium]